MNTTFQAMTGYYIESGIGNDRRTARKGDERAGGSSFSASLGSRTGAGARFHGRRIARRRTNVVIISDRYWRNRFGADPQILNRKLQS